MQAEIRQGRLLPNLFHLRRQLRHRVTHVLGGQLHHPPPLRSLPEAQMLALGRVQLEAPSPAALQNHDRQIKFQSLRLVHGHQLYGPPQGRAGILVLREEAVKLPHRPSSRPVESPPGPEQRPRRLTQKSVSGQAHPAQPAPDHSLRPAVGKIRQGAEGKPFRPAGHRRGEHSCRKSARSQPIGRIHRQPRRQKTGRPEGPLIRHRLLPLHRHPQPLLRKQFRTLMRQIICAGQHPHRAPLFQNSRLFHNLRHRHPDLLPLRRANFHMPLAPVGFLRLVPRPTPLPPRHDLALHPRFPQGLRLKHLFHRP